jgi:predicted nucleotidyltransferase
MRQTNPSLDALIPVLHQRILVEILVRSPDRPLYRGELARRLDVPGSSLQRPLAALVGTGVLRKVRHGREVLFEVDRANPFLPELLGLLRKTRGLADVVRHALEPLRGRIDVAFIFGSFATASARTTSDVDVMVIGDASVGDLASPLHDAEEALGREVNAIAYTATAVRSRVLAKSHFLLTVLEQPRLLIVGTEPELEAIVGGRPGAAASRAPGGIRGATDRRRPQPARRPRRGRQR